MHWLNDNVWLFWIGVALVLAAIEAATVDFVFIMFAWGALAAALAAGLGASFPVQVVVAVGVALLLLLSVRPLIKRQFLDGEVDRTIGTSALVGREARVLQSVTDSDGRIKLGGETWVGPARRRRDHHGRPRRGGPGHRHPRGTAPPPPPTYYHLRPRHLRPPHLIAPRRLAKG